MATPLILTTEQERDIWLNAPKEEALKLIPAPAGTVTIVARGDAKSDEVAQG